MRGLLQFQKSVPKSPCDAFEKCITLWYQKDKTKNKIKIGEKTS